MDKSTAIRTVYKRLLDPSFRAQLSATAPNGEIPIVVALHTEELRDTLAEMRAVGGVANLVVAFDSGFMVLSLRHTEAMDSHDVPELSDRCTIGLLVARLIEDGGFGSYQVRSSDDNTVENGTGTVLFPIAA